MNTEHEPPTSSTTHSLTDSLVQQSINPLIQQSINPSSTSATPSTLDPSAPKRLRAKGKIPALPKHQRDLIDQILDDGGTYKVVELEMAKHGVSLNGENISNWFNGPYQDHLRELER